MDAVNVLDRLLAGYRSGSASKKISENQNILAATDWHDWQIADG
jgi:hypothetical protein